MIVRDFSCGLRGVKRIPQSSDTATRRNLARSHINQRGQADRVFHGPHYSIRDANREMLNSRGAIKLLIKLRSYAASKTFVVREELHVPMFLRTRFTK